jgi:hypothetical protein
MQEIAKAYDATNDIAQLNIEIMQASHDAAGALAAQRELELTAIANLKDATPETIATLTGLKKTLYGLQDAAAEAAIVTQGRQIEVKMLQVQGKGMAALALSRDLEREAMQDAPQKIKDLTEELWKLEDVATAVSQMGSIFDMFATPAQRVAAATIKVNAGFAALGVVVPKNAAEFLALAEAQDTTTVAGQAFINSLFELAPAFQTTQQAVNGLADALKNTVATIMSAAQAKVDTARANLRAAYEREAGILKQTADTARAAATDMAAFRKELLNGAMSGKTVTQTYAALSAQLNKAGAASLRQVGGDFLSASAITSRTRVDYQRDVARVAAAALRSQNEENAQAKMAERQLAALTEEVGHLIDLKSATLSVHDAIVALGVQLGSWATLQATQWTQTSADAYLAAQKVSEQAIIDNKNTADLLYIKTNPPMPTSPLVTAAASGTIADPSVVPILKVIHTAIVSGNIAIAKNTSKAARIWSKFDGDGMPAVRTV